MHRHHYVALLICISLLGATSPADETEDLLGAIAPIVQAFRPDTAAGSALNGVLNSETEGGWLFRGIPFHMGGRYAHIDSYLGAVLVSAWIHGGIMDDGTPWIILFSAHPKGLATEQANRAERNRKFGEVVRHMVDLVPQQARRNMKRVLDVTRCSGDVAQDMGLLLKRYGTPNQFAAIVADDPDLYGGPFIGIRLSEEWILEVSIHHGLDPGAEGTLFFSLAKGSDHTAPFAECYDETTKSWQYWPLYNPFDVSVPDGP